MSIPTEAEHHARVRSVTLTLEGDLEPASAEAQAAWLLQRASKHVQDSRTQIVRRVLPRFYDEVKRLPLHDLARTTLQEDSAIAALLEQLVIDTLHEAARTLDRGLAIDMTYSLLNVLTPTPEGASS